MTVIFAVAVDTSYPVKDMFYERDRIYRKKYPAAKRRVRDLVS